MNQFAWLLDRLSYEPGRNNKLRMMVDYFRSTPDPERGYALAALTGSLSFQHAKPNLVRALAVARVDEYLFGLSYDYVGDLSEAVALLWPAPPRPAAAAGNGSPLTLSEVVGTLGTAGKLDLPRLIAGWLDALDENGRWALLKLITGSLRVGVSARLAKTAVGELGGIAANEVEEVWHGLRAPYIDLFAWVEGREDKPDATDPAPFHPAMLAHPLEERDVAALDPAGFTAEWKWDGIRVQATRGVEADGSSVVRLYSRTGEDVSETFPDLGEALAGFPHPRFSLDGELLVVRNALVQPFGVLQQRLNRRTVSLKVIADYPAHIRAYDLLQLDGDDLQAASLRRAARQARRLRRRRRRATGSTCRRSSPSPIGRASPHARKHPRDAGAGGGRRGDRRLDAEAHGLHLRARPPARPVVQVEARPLHGGRRRHVRPARPRQALVLLLRLHLRRLAHGRGGHGAGPGGQGLLRLHRRGARQARPLRAQQHDQPLRSRCARSRTAWPVRPGAGDRLRRA